MLQEKNVQNERMFSAEMRLHQHK